MITASKAANYIRAFQEINVNFYGSDFVLSTIS